MPATNAGITGRGTADRVITVRLADLDQLTDDGRATITNVTDPMVTKAKLRLITGGAS